MIEELVAVCILTSMAATTALAFIVLIVIVVTMVNWENKKNMKEKKMCVSPFTAKLILDSCCF
jgi:hypothetical protein